MNDKSCIEILGSLGSKSFVEGVFSVTPTIMFSEVHKRLCEFKISIEDKTSEELIMLNDEIELHKKVHKKMLNSNPMSMAISFFAVIISLTGTLDMPKGVILVFVLFLAIASIQWIKFNFLYSINEANDFMYDKAMILVNEKIKEKQIKESEEN